MPHDDTANLVEAQLAELRAAFEVFDTNGDGRLSARELKAALKSLRQPASDDDVRKMIALVDANRDGVVDFDEFCQLVEPAPHGEDPLADLRQAFDVLDSDSDGYLTARELRAAVVDADADIDETEVRRILAGGDTDGDGRISFPEFCALMTRG
jgi:Ca2+-binding EF-hand superfamily protein